MFYRFKLAFEVAFVVDSYLEFEGRYYSGETTSWKAISLVMKDKA